MIKSFRSEKPEIAASVYIAEDADIIGNVKIAVRSSVWFKCVIRGDVHHIVIGERTNIQDLSMIHVSGGKFPTVIGSDVTIGHKVLLHGCRVGNNVLVGMGAMIMDGAVIGDNSIVAAGSLVAPGKTFPEGALLMGRPAKFIRNLTEEEIQANRTSAVKYADLAKEYMQL